MGILGGISVNCIRLAFILLLYLFGLPFTVAAGDYDGSKKLLGSVARIVEVTKFGINEDVDPGVVGLPEFFIIDFKAMTLRPTKESLIRKTSRIRYIEHIENKLMLQGVEQGVDGINDGLGWSMAISKDTGRIILSAAGDGVAYVVFGMCAPAPDYDR